MSQRRNKIESFDIPEGEILSGKYEVIQYLGKGWEGEVYLVKELETGIERAAKLFFPQRNNSNKTLKYYAKKLHELRHCSILIQYHTQDVFNFEDRSIPVLISEFVEGELLADFIKSQPGKRLHPYQALHLLHSLAEGVAEIHRCKEYHGDIHTENIIIQSYGLGFDLKLIDIFKSKDHTKPESIHHDIYDMIAVFHESIGGRARYSKQHPAIKSICLGLRRPAIRQKFKTTTKLLEHLENIEWD